MVVRSPIVIKGTPVDGTGDPLLTRDATTSELGTVASLGSGFVSSTLASGNIIVGNGSNVATSVAMSGDGTISNTGVFAIAAGSIVNGDVNASAAITYNKLNLTGSVVNNDINASAAIVYTKLLLTDSILNTDINSAAAIARTKLASGTAYRILANNASGVLSENAAITASRAVAADTNGQLVASATTATQLGYLSTTTSDVQVQMNTKIASQQTNALAQSPTVTQDGYAITWDNTAGEYTLTDPVTQGIPVGGSTRQFLGKNTGSNYDASWLTLQLSDVTDVSASPSDVNLLTGQVTSGLTSTHLSYVIGATSNIQAQLNTKLSSTLAQNSVLVGNASNVATPVAAGSEGQVFTISSGVPTWQTIVGTGSVTSVDVSGGTTGLSFTGGPVTTTGTITASGTLIVANGGTGLTALGTALQYLRVNAGATALEYATLPTIIGGATGATDNAILRADGTGGVTLQNSLISINDTGSLVIPDSQLITSTSSNSGVLITSNQSILYGGNSEISVDNTTGIQAAVTTASGDGIKFTTNSSLTNSVSNFRIEHQTSGTPAAGIGAGLVFQVETSSSNVEAGVSIESIATDVTATSEDFDLIFKTMAAGATAAERFRLKSTSQVQFNGYTTTTSFTGTPVGYLQFDASGNILTSALPAGSGDVVGPASATDNAITRFDSTTGKLIQNSTVTLSDTGTFNSSSGISFLSTSTIGITPVGVLTLAGSGGTTLGGVSYTTSAAQLISIIGGDISGSGSGQGHVKIKGGSTAVNGINAGDVYINSGDTTGTGLGGNAALFVDSVSNWQTGQKVLFVGNRIAAPTGNPADGVFMYAEDLSASSKLKLRDEAGNAGFVPIVLYGSATLNFGSIAAGTKEDLTITVTGAAVGDPVVPGIPHGSVDASALFMMWVSATDTVTVRCANIDVLSSIDPASGTFKATVIKQ